MFDSDWTEHYIKKGNPAKPTYYIIRRQNPTVGLFSNYLVFAGKIKYAFQHGYIPVIDMKNYPNSYLPPNLLGKENAWEYYFEQPFKVSLDEAYNGENVILSDGGVAEFPNTNMATFNNRNNILTEWRMLVKLGLLKVRDDLMKEFTDIYNKIFSPSDRVMGVHMRGTDYTATRPHAHPIPPPPEYAMPVIITKMNAWNCNKLFLATEDKKYIPLFKQIFGDACIVPENNYLDYNENNPAWISTIHSDRENDFYLRGKEYLSNMVMLSKCNNFITCRCSGSVGVMMMANNFENVLAFNLGCYNTIALHDFLDE